MWRPGDKARESGLYEIVAVDGKGTGIVRAVARGERFPPTPSSGLRYRLARRVIEVGTSVASNAVILGTSSDFRGALDKLAKK